MKELRDDAVVIRSYRSGESDRIVVLWTRSHGKVRVVAKGVRKSTSRLGGNLETLAYVDVDLVKTRGDFFIARHVAHRQRLTTLRGDYARINAGYAVVEVVDAIPSEDVADEGVFDLLIRVLTTLDDPLYNPVLVPASFYLKLLVHDGSEPVLDQCVNCARPGPLVAFDASIGGALCSQCRSGSSISPDGLTLLRRILGGDLGTVLREDDPPGAAEVAVLAQDSIESHFGRRLRVSRSYAPLAPPRIDR
ncbi:MAG: DNA repair protein RecO [Acidimicrobiaceae bacterium]|nr:DNA repair protein RecO [Acidimicrobiaceae bacterium]